MTTIFEFTDVLMHDQMFFDDTTKYLHYNAGATTLELLTSTAGQKVKLAAADGASVTCDSAVNVKNNLVMDGTGQIKSLSDPTSAQDGATKNYVDTKVRTAGQGLSLAGVELSVKKGDGIQFADDAIAVDTSVVRTIGSQTINGPKHFTNFPILPEGNPSSPAEAASKGYVDSVAQGLSVKDPCYAATTVALNATYENGSNGQWATLTNAGSLTAFALDGISISVGKRVLIKDQTSALQNGIYTVSDAGSSTTQWILTRDNDFNQPQEVWDGAFVFVGQGAVNANHGFVQTATVNEIGTDSINFVQFSGAGQITAGSGLDKSGNTLSVNVSGSGVSGISGGMIIVGDSLEVDNTVIRTTGNQTLTGTKIFDDQLTVGSNGAFTINSGAGGVVINRNITMNSNKVVSLADPTSAQDGATKNYVDTKVRTAGNGLVLNGTALDVQVGNGIAIVSDTVEVDSTVIRTTGAQSIGGVKTFTSIPVLPATNPTQANEAVRKDYVDSVASGLAVKSSCVVASTHALTVTYANGTSGGVGATLTNADTTKVAFSLDGVHLSHLDRVLIKDQASALQNGIYTVTTVGDDLTNWVLTRAKDFDSPSEIQDGSFVFISQGTLNADNGFVQTATVTTVGTSAINFSQFSGAGQIVAGGGLTKTGNTLDVGAGTGITVAADSVAVDSTVVRTTGSQTISGTKTFIGPLVSFSGGSATVGTNTNFSLAAGGTGTATCNRNLSMGTSYKIIDLSDPTSAQDGATKNYVDTNVRTAGSGLGLSGVDLSVNTGDGIQIVTDAVAVDSTVVRTTGTQSIGGSKTFTGKTIVPNITGGSGDTEAANKGYVDSVAQGLAVKKPTRVGTTANLTATYNNNGSGISATLTNSDTLKEALSIDGIYLALDDRVLVKNQDTDLENGIYKVTTVGDSTTNWVLTRTFDHDEIAEIQDGSFVFVQDGSTNADSGWVQTDFITAIGTSSVNYVQFSGAGQVTAGNGLTKTGNTLDVGAGTGITVNSNDVAVNQAFAPTWTGIHNFTNTTPLQINGVTAGVWSSVTVGASTGMSSINSTQHASYSQVHKTCVLDLNFNFTCNASGTTVVFTATNPPSSAAFSGVAATVCFVQQTTSTHYQVARFELSGSDTTPLAITIRGNFYNAVQYQAVGQLVYQVA